MSKSFSPSTSLRKKGKKLTKQEKGSIVQTLITDAEQYIDAFIAPQRLKATQYANGDPFGNEEEGRSQVVMTEVRDVVQSMLPSLLRVFLSTENAVEYAPRRADAVEMAEQATDYINYVFYNDNQGAQVLYSLLKDALIRKTGIAKWYVDESEKVTEEHYGNITEDQLAFLEADEELKLTDLNEILPAGFDDDEIDPTTGQPILQPALYNASFKRTVTTKRFVVEALPPEEFIIARSARTEDDAELIGHRKDALVSDLIAMGYDYDELMEHGSPQPTLEINMESNARNPVLRAREILDVSKLDPSMARIRYYETLVRMDADGDGIAELHKICSIGDHGLYILHDEIVADVNFAIFCPDPEPHTAIGKSIADQIMDLQLIKSNIVRNTLDSLAQTIHPRTAVIEGQVNMDDALNTETGGIVRVRSAGAIQPLDQPFVGQQALGVLAYLDDVRAQRTGISRATQGLDADVLQSTTKAAVTATVSAAQERLEMVSRILADGGMKRLFRGLLKMVIQNQDKERTVRLRGKWVDVNPTGWDADMDVVVNVGLGQSNRAEKIAGLTTIAAKQEEILKTLGPDNALCDMGQYRATLGKILEQMGFKDTDTYLKEVTPQAIQQMQQAMAQNKPQDPSVILAQAEMQKTMADIAIKKAELTLKEQEMRLSDDRERNKTELDAYLQAAEIQAKYGTQINMAQLQAQIDHQRNLMTAAIQATDSANAANNDADANAIQHANNQAQIAQKGQQAALQARIAQQAQQQNGAQPA